MTQFATAFSALKWFVDAGIDTIVADEPRNWLSAAVTSAAPPAAVETETPSILRPGNFASWEALDRFLIAFPDVPLRTSRPPLLCAGTRGAGLMLLSDMPTIRDQAEASAFSGEEGTLLNRMLAAVGQGRETTYLANFCPWRDGAALRDGGSIRHFWTDFTTQHIALAAPKSLLLLGNTVAEALLGLELTKARGRWHMVEAGEQRVPALVSFTPAWLLRQPAHKALAWADLQMWMKGPVQ